MQDMNLRTKRVGGLIVCAVLAMQGCSRGSDAGRNTSSGDNAAPPSETQATQTPTSSAVADAAPPPGLAIYNRSCVSCHSMGAAGAPRLGDRAAWAPRIAKGRDALLQSALHGMPPGMPAKGLCITCSDDELRQVIDYMISKSE